MYNIHMSVKFFDVFSKTDWAKITILIIVAVIAWTWVFIEFKKPIVYPYIESPSAEEQ